MLLKKQFLAFLTGLMLFNIHPLTAQYDRVQYPFGMKNTYFGVDVGYINYPFSSEQLEPGYQVESIDIPHPAVRVVLYGLPLGKYFSARLTVMRPVTWVQYNNVNGDQTSHSVWMNIAGVTLDGRLPLSKKLSLTAEAGLGVITRHGFSVDDQAVVASIVYASGLFGGSFQYQINTAWDVHLSTAWSPENKEVNQPETFFLGAGINYHLLPLSEERLKKNSNSGYIFPLHFIMAGYSNNFLGYGVNDLAANDYFPIFWRGSVYVRQGLTFSYQRNVFHGRKVFAFDMSASTGFWQTTENKEWFFTLSLNPILRFYALHSKSLDLFFEYSLAGPTFISKTELDDIQTGEKFTFHDFIGVGTFAGQKKKLYAGIRIAHFSNGNLFPQNPGVTVPLTFNLGYVLDK
jgi:hypothetical protein